MSETKAYFHTCLSSNKLCDQILLDEIMRCSSSFKLLVHLYVFSPVPKLKCYLVQIFLFMIFAN